MKTAIILKEHLDYFKELDPFSFLDRADFPDRICVGTVIEGGEGGYDIPAGLLVLKVDETAVIIEWIYVRTELRARHIGTELMEYAYRTARMAGFKDLKLYRNNVQYRDAVCSHEKSFLDEYDFKPDTELPGEWNTNIETLIKHPLIGQNAQGFDRTIALAGLDQRQLEDLSLYLLSDPPGTFLYASLYAADLADKNVSRVMIHDGSVSGVIFAQLSGETLYIIGIAGRNRAEQLSLCHGALMAALQKYGFSQRICIIKINSSNVNMIRGIIKEKPVRCCIYSTSVTNYEDHIRNFERAENFDSLCSSLVDSKKDLRDPEDDPSMKALMQEDENAVEAEETFMYSASEYVSCLELNTAKREDLRLLRSDDIDIKMKVSDLKLARIPDNMVTSEVTGFGKLTEGDRWNCISFCLLNKVKGILKDLENLPLDWYEKDLSCCIITPSGVEGILLVRTLPSGLLMPVLIHASGDNTEKNIMSMIKYTRDSAMKKYSEDTKIIIRTQKKILQKVIAYVFQKRRSKNVAAGN